MRKGTKMGLKRASIETSHSRPAPYYNQSSLLKEMESKEIGTKATRSEIIKSIIDRKSIHGEPLQITPIGKIVNEVLGKYSPQVISIELSREMELMGDLIENPNEQFTLSDAVVQGIVYLHQILDKLRSNEDKVGKLIDQGLKKQRKESVLIGKCPNCKEGDLKIIRNQATGKRFVGCSLFFDNQRCTTTFPLPQKGKLMVMDKLCPADGYPQLRVFGGKKPWVLCLNPECPKRKEFLKRKESKGREKK